MKLSIPGIWIIIEIQFKLFFNFSLFFIDKFGHKGYIKIGSRSEARQWWKMGTYCRMLISVLFACVPHNGIIVILLHLYFMVQWTAAITNFKYLSNVIKCHLILFLVCKRKMKADKVHVYFSLVQYPKYHAIGISTNI